MLSAGTKAPDFSLKDQFGKDVSLTDFLGKKVVLYFYSRDNTPGCSRQACAFAGAYEEFMSMDAVVIGVSKDSVASHVKFAEKYSLPFVLLSDPELEAIKAYDVWQEKKKDVYKSQLLDKVFAVSAGKKQGPCAGTHQVHISGGQCFLGFSVACGAHALQVDIV